MASHSRVIPRKTKIVATLGPGSFPRLRELIEAGVDLFRLNFSHSSTTNEEFLPVITQVRKFSKELNRPVALLGDLCGPKIRVGTFVDKKIELITGSSVTLCSGLEQGHGSIIYTPIKEVVAALEIGHRVLLDDGKLVLKVSRRVSEVELVCEVLVGGPLSDKKGLNVPDLSLDISALTEKDRRDATFALQQGLDWLALSFVQKASDVQDLLSHIGEYHLKNPEAPRNRPGIIAKIEKPQALDVIDSILAITDGIMVARGDLGVEVSLEMVPFAQKDLIAKCNDAGKPVITATQMLESMINSPSPTRAEVSDVANAVLDGTDAVMLSAETAVGSFPVEAVKMMATICLTAEKQMVNKPRSRTTPSLGSFEFHRALADSAVNAAEEISASVIIAFTQTGRMGQFLAQRRPVCPIVALSATEWVHRRLVLYSGIIPVYLPAAGGETSTEKALAEAEKVTLALASSTGEWARSGDSCVVCSGGHDVNVGLDSILRLTRLGRAIEHHRTDSQGSGHHSTLQRRWSLLPHKTSQHNIAE